MLFFDRFREYRSLIEIIFIVFDKFKLAFRPASFFEAFFQTHGQDLDEIQRQSLLEFDLFCPMYLFQHQLQAIFEQIEL